MNKAYIFFIFIFLIAVSLFIFNYFSEKTNKINSHDFSYFKFGKVDELNKEYREYIKNIDFSKSKEVNGLKLFIKPMKVVLTDKIYIKEYFFLDLSLFETKQEKLESIIKEEPRKKINLHHLEIIEIIKNVSNKTIYFCSCYRNGGFYGVYGAKYGQEPNHLNIPFFPVEGAYYPQPYLTEYVQKILPGQISTITYNLKNTRDFKKGHTYSLFTKYELSSSKSSPITFTPSINGKAVSSKEISLPIWEGELQSNALTVVVR